jgi:hypothetical protein
LSVHGTNAIRQTKIHPPEILVLEPNFFEVDIPFETLKRYKSSSVFQITAKLIQG